MLIQLQHDSIRTKLVQWLLQWLSDMLLESSIGQCGLDVWQERQPQGLSFELGVGLHSCGFFAVVAWASLKGIARHERFPGFGYMEYKRPVSTM
jgi:hypothetical protein